MKKYLAFLLAILLMYTAPCAFGEEEPEQFTSGGYTYVLDAERNACITKWEGVDEALTIPAQLDGHAVRALAIVHFSDVLRSKASPFRTA